MLLKTFSAVFFAHCIVQLFKGLHNLGSAGSSPTEGLIYFGSLFFLNENK